MERIQYKNEWKISDSQIELSQVKVITEPLETPQTP